MTQIDPILLQQQINAQGLSSTQTANPYNLVSVKTAKEVGQIADKEIGTMPYRIATAGYSAPPQGY